MDKQSSLPYTGRHIPAKVFERHLQYFKQHFEIVPVEDIFHMNALGIEPEKRTLAITFDDGYRNNFEVAFPLLEKYEVPATMYVSAVCLENPDYVIWADILDIIREEQGEAGIQIRDFDFRPGPPYDMVEVNSGQLLSNLVKTMPIGERDKFLQEVKIKYRFNELYEQHGVTYWRLMNKKQVRTIAESKWVDIGSHGYKHYNQGNIPPMESKKRLAHSKRLLETHTGRPCLSLAYPDANYTPKVKEIATQVGYKYQLALNYRWEEDEEDPRILPRVNVSGTTTYHSQIVHLHQQFRKLGF